MIPQLLALADDLTGALETGAALAAAGIDSAVSTVCDFDAAAVAGDRPGLVIDTETRHLRPHEASERVHALAAAAAAAGVPYLFKKTDSTLRGNIAAELAGLAAVCPASPLIYLPAYPQLGRTVRDGVLFVDGRPVSRTEFRVDRLNPVNESHIPSLLSTAGSKLPVVSLRPVEIDRARDAAIYVVDGEDEADLITSTGALSVRAERFVLAGPARCAHHFARAISGGRNVQPPPLASRRSLVINGSRHPASEDQVRQAIEEGAPFVGPDGVRSALERSGWAVLKTPDHTVQGELEFARAVGRTVARILGDTPLDSLVVFGGDTLFAIVTALGSPVLRSLGEVIPGVAASLISPAALARALPGRAHDLLVVSKAGGFGAADALRRIRERISGV